MTDGAVTTRSYPLPRPDDDPRFTLGLLSDVADVLERHGYPRPRAADDLTTLQQALFRFLYAAPGLVLQDLDEGRTITNDAEPVITDLATRDLLRGRRVVYRGTNGSWDEIVHDGHRFDAFRPFTRTQVRETS